MQWESLFGGWDRACWRGASADNTPLHGKTRAGAPGCVCPSRVDACMHAGRRCGFTAPVRCRSAAEELEVTVLGLG